MIASFASLFVLRSGRTPIDGEGNIPLQLSAGVTPRRSAGGSEQRLIYWIDLSTPAVRSLVTSIIRASKRIFRLCLLPEKAQPGRSGEGVRGGSVGLAI